MSQVTSLPLLFLHQRWFHLRMLILLHLGLTRDDGSHAIVSLVERL